MMPKFYWMHKEYGYLVPETDLFTDAEEMEYDDIVDPCSCEYRNFNLYYAKTNMIVGWVYSTNNF